MNKLYPIGTQLITRRLSQAALCDEIFCWETIESCVPGGWAKGFSIYGRDRDDYITQWRVMVTAENQKWLSPVPMVGDFVWIENMGMAFEIGVIADNVVFKSAHKNPFADAESGHSVSNFYCSIEDNPKIISRIYPNGQRAPLIEWDKAILPQQGASS